MIFYATFRLFLINDETDKKRKVKYLLMLIWDLDMKSLAVIFLDHVSLSLLLLFVSVYHVKPQFIEKHSRK